MASIEVRTTSSGPRWRVVWRQDGQKQQQTYADQAAAEAFHRRVEAYGNRWPPGEDPRVQRAAAGPLTFGAWARTAIRHRTRANERTKADYLRDLDNHFALLDGEPLDKVSAEHVTLWLEQLAAAGLSGKTIRNLHGFASSLYVDALAQHPPIAAHNPFARKLGDIAAVHTEEMVFLTPAEFAQVHQHIRDERHYPELIRLLAGTGARFGEATALTVGDVNLFTKRKTVTITKAWKRQGSSGWKIGEPKTPRSRRTIALSDELVDMLRPLVAKRDAADLLFPGAGGGRLPHIEVYKRGWAPAVARARVCRACYLRQKDGRGNRPTLPEPCKHRGVLAKEPRIHDLRHSHASWLIADGVSLPVISRRLGHSSITITMDRYGHLDPALDAEVNASIDKALGRR